MLDIKDLDVDVKHTPHGLHIRQQLVIGYLIISFILIVAMGINYLASTEIIEHNERASNLIKASIGIMVFALFSAFIIMIKIIKHVVNLVDEVNHNRDWANNARDIAEQKSLELDNTSRVLIKTNHNLINSIEELNNTRDQLVLNEKMASLGELVAGVAHEINTPIGISVTAASHLQDTVNSFTIKFESGEITKTEFSNFLQDSNEGCDILLHNLHRAAKLIRSFKQVAVDQTSEHRRQFNLKETIEETLISLRPKTRKTQITINLDCPNNIIINSFPGDYSQIISNLITNSLLHAFSANEKGTINIHVTLSESNINISYCDDGKGVNKENLNKLFTPFYTTQRGEGGSGLGLHIVFNIVTHKLKGDIKPLTVCDDGLCFELALPLNIL